MRTPRERRQLVVDCGTNLNQGYNIQQRQDVTKMANFARSLKSHTLLSPRMRPSMPSRALSNSSDMSVTSNNTTKSDDCADLLASRPSTPMQVSGGFGGSGNGQDHDTASRDHRDDHDAASIRTSHPSSTRPITIELPKIKRFSTAPVRTTPEPVSARGDLPGGYFPFHEDPKARIHRPHPFHHDPKRSPARSSGVISDTAHNQSEPPATTLAVDPNMAPSDTPVASYLPSGFHHSPLPMGKYYPSNYEQRNSNNNKTNYQPSQRPSASGALASSVKSDSQVPTLATGAGPTATIPETEARRRLQQYKRDMIAQATLAASEILGGSTNARAQPRGGLRLEDLPTMEGRFSAPLQKPISPRLLPLGSPGPVTPMDLESSAGGAYVDKGNNESRRSREGLVPPGAGFTARTS